MMVSTWKATCTVVVLTTVVQVAVACTQACFCFNNYNLGDDMKYITDLNKYNQRYTYQYYLYKYYTANCTFSNLTELPFGLQSNVVILKVEFNNIDSLQTHAFSKLGVTGLNIIYLNNNTIANIHPDAFKDLVYLQKLVLDNNRITDLPLDVFECCPQLKYLSLNGNDLYQISHDVKFKSLTSLESLYLAHCNLSFLPEQIYDLNLNMLNISNNQLCNLNVTKFKYVEQLHAQNNFKVNFDNDQQTNSFKLKSLNLNGNTLIIPNNSSNFNASSLEYLSLHSCNLNTLPLELFKHSKQIKILILRNNNISEFDVSTLHELMHLALDNNSIQSIDPNAFANNTKLYNLSIAGNPLQLPEGRLFIHSTLKVLSLADCEINKISADTFKNTPMLEYVNLELNTLKNIDNETFHGLRNLIYLNLATNLISTIHQDAFITNVNLIILLLNKNQLLLLPPEGSFLNAAKLTILDISSCNITKLPINTFKSTPYLEYIYLNNNSLQRLDIRIFKNLKKLYYLEMSNNPLFCDYELKEIWKWSTENYVRSNANCVEPKGNWKLLEHLHVEQKSSKVPVTSQRTLSPSTMTTSTTTVVSLPMSTLQPELQPNESLESVQEKSRTLSTSLMIGLAALGCLIGIVIGVALDFAITRYFKCVRFTHSPDNDLLMS